MMELSLITRLQNSLHLEVSFEKNDWLDKLAKEILWQKNHGHVSDCSQNFLGGKKDGNVSAKLRKNRSNK